ncbi:MAG: toast rack family protein [Anaerolineae bacterium]|nr:toast rack family protein [Anaerolineae bacterium]
MKKSILFVAVVMVLTSLACSISVPDKNIEVGEKETFKFSQPVPADKETTHMSLSMGAGRLDINGGSEGLMDGEVVYNISALKPSVKTGDHSVTLSQSGELKNFPGSDMVNDWNIKLGKSPIDLSINAGAYNGTMELGGIPLTQLSVRDGASKVKLNFDEPNPVTMSRLEYYTGASKVELSGLSNANFNEMRFEGGAGSFKLDFSGKLQRDGSVTVIGGVNDIEIIIPKGTPAVITMTGALSNVNTEGTWTVHSGVYETEGSGPKLTIEVENGVGNLTLRQK